MPRLRLRLSVAHWPRRALILTDTPRPDCDECRGEGGIEQHYGDYQTGEYVDTDWIPCDCWDEDRRWALFPLPHLPRRRTPVTDPWGPPGGYTDEPPF
ncbi:hypothetical protein MBT42_24985 [Streptomyces sp. MBT42]|uniref:hypothetical protein n=1 Tax=Streptomyces sp. MBT42 TaxID=1488373 RepID=UPI001E626216|nr:hypothetical protein [Streptomyces sp. MBT42]MCD2466795.1 hypothetical protein [Streptomyces sp. MBT42]